MAICPGAPVKPERDAAGGRPNFYTWAVSSPLVCVLDTKHALRSANGRLRTTGASTWIRGFREYHRAFHSSRRGNCCSHTSVRGWNRHQQRLTVTTDHNSSPRPHISSHGRDLQWSITRQSGPCCRDSIKPILLAVACTWFQPVTKAKNRHLDWANDERTDARQYFAPASRSISHPRPQAGWPPRVSQMPSRACGPARLTRQTRSHVLTHPRHCHDRQDAVSWRMLQRYRSVLYCPGAKAASGIASGVVPLALLKACPSPAGAQRSNILVPSSFIVR
jgi:hypothetical protein